MSGFLDITWGMAFKIIAKTIAVSLGPYLLATFIMNILIHLAGEASEGAATACFIFSTIIAPIIFAWALGYVLKRRLGKFKLLFISEATAFREPYTLIIGYMLMFRLIGQSCLMMILYMLLLIPLNIIFDIDHSAHPLRVMLLLTIPAILFSFVWGLRRTAKKGFAMAMGRERLFLKATLGN